MDLNFLSRLLSPAGTAPPYAPVPAQPQPGARAPVNLLAGIAGPVAAPQDNLLEQLGAAPASDVSPPGNAPTRPARARSSAVDIVGRLADVFAKVGGAEALYQPTLDARQDREIALENYDRSVDLNALKMQQMEQGIEAGGLEIANDERARLAQALGAVAGNRDAASLWPQIAEQAGIDLQKAEAIGGLIQRNPNAANILSRSLGLQEPKVSMSREMQNYQLLREQGAPGEAEAYLRTISQPDAITPYQSAQIRLRREENADTRAYRQATIDLGRERQANRPAGGAISPGQRATDTAFGKQYEEYVARGGFADVQKGLRQLREARNMLREGGVTGGVTGYLPTPLRSVFNERSVSAQEAVEEVVQRNLRLILGAQFTQKEGERLIERSYNPRLSEAENIKRIDRLIGQMETAARETQRSAEYFEQNGTLQGFRGSTPRRGTGARPQPRSAPVGPPRRIMPTNGRPAMSPLAQEMARRGLIR